MKLENINSNEDLLAYIQGLVNDFQGVEVQSDVTEKTKKMYNDILELGLFMVELSKRKKN